MWGQDCFRHFTLPLLIDMVNAITPTPKADTGISTNSHTLVSAMSGILLLTGATVWIQTIGNDNRDLAIGKANSNFGADSFCMQHAKLMACVASRSHWVKNYLSGFSGLPASVSFPNLNLCVLYCTCVDCDKSVSQSFAGVCEHCWWQLIAEVVGAPFVEDVLDLWLK